MKQILTAGLFFSVSLIPVVFAQTAATITETELVHRTQQLYDSLPAGDRSLWIETYADDVMVYDEKGRSMNKQAFLADLDPMPAGYSGTIRVIHPHTIFAPGAAILAYECEETETIFGQELLARYHSVDTWLYREGKWQIAATQTMRYYEDPAVGTTDLARLRGFAGTYELTPGKYRNISLDSNRIFLQRDSGAKMLLVPESGDLFFRTGVEGRILFHRDATGNVDALIDRRNNEDVVWKRIPALGNSISLQEAPAAAATDPFAQLAVYNGTWVVKAEHPWGGGAPGTMDHLVSHCYHFNRYFACEQTVNSKTQSLLVYTASNTPGKLNCRQVAPDGLAGGRGDLTLDGSHWTYVDKPPLHLKGNWSRVENFILDQNHIRFEEYESQDEGKSWTKLNTGTEERTAPNAGTGAGPEPAGS